MHGAIFTRGPKDLHNTAIFIGGTDMAAGERLLGAVQKAFFGPMRVSVMLDSNGSNTTAVAAVAKLQQAAGDVEGTRARSSPPAPDRWACAPPACSRKAGADVDCHVAASRGRRAGRRAIRAAVRRRRCARSRWPTARSAAAALEGAELLLNAGRPASGSCRATRGSGAPGLRAAADLNAVPPLGIEGIEVTDNGAERDGVTTFGALGVGSLKMKIHKACIARLFERNDLVLDAETIAESAEALIEAAFERLSTRRPIELPRMPRVIGIDPGTVSIDLCGLDDGRVFLDRSLPTAEALADPALISRAARAHAAPLDLVAGRPATACRSPRRAISPRPTSAGVSRAATARAAASADCGR